jgi:hypothetical protein
LKNIGAPRRRITYARAINLATGTIVVSFPSARFRLLQWHNSDAGYHDRNCKASGSFAGIKIDGCMERASCES